MLFLLTAAVATTAGVVTFYRPSLGLIFITVMIPLDYSMEIGITVFSNEMLLGGVLLGWVVCLFRTRVLFKISWTEVVLGIPFILAILLSAVNAEDFSTVAKQTLRWLQFILVVWYAANALENMREVKIEINLLIGMGVLVSILGIIQSLGGMFNFNQSQMMFYQEKFMRAYSTFGHPNQFAGYLLCIIPITLVRCLYSLDKRSKVSMAVGLLIMLTAFILTYTRGAWLSALIVGIGWLYASVSKKTFAVALAGLVIGFILLFAAASHLHQPAVIQRIISIAHLHQDDSVNVRTRCVQTAMRMFCEHPLIGFGAGEYATNIRKYFGEDYYAWEAVNKHIHNLYLQILIESGLLGLAGFLLFVFFQMGKLVQAFFLCWPRVQRAVLEAVIVGALAFLMANNFDVLTVYARGIHFSVLIGLGLAIVRLHAFNPARDRGY